MSKLSTRATSLLALMREPDGRHVPFPGTYPNHKYTGWDYTTDGEWFRLHAMPGFARKTITALLEAGAIEGDGTGYYRLTTRNEWLWQDFGDLWVPG